MRNLFAAAILISAVPAIAQSLTVGMYVPANDPNAAAQSRALAAFVKQATGAETKSEPFTSYDALSEALAKGTVDVAMVPPLALVRAERQGAKLEPLARVVRNGQPTYRAVLF